MFVLPRITAPASRSRSGDVGVVRGEVPVQDPRAGRGLAAANRDEVLERHGNAGKRMERVQRSGSIPAGRGEPDVGRVGVGERALVVDRRATR